MICPTFFPGAKHSRSYQSSKYAEGHFLFRRASFASLVRTVWRGKRSHRGDCAEILKKIWIVLHFVSLRLFPAAGHIARGEHSLI